jgi:hypothetical protein
MTESFKTDYQNTLKRLLTLDRKLTDTFETQQEWVRLQKDAEARSYDPPKLKNLWKAPFRAFLWTLILFTGLMILFGITGLAFGHYAFSYVMWLPLTLKALVFSVFGNPWPLPDTVTPEHVRSWLSGIDYAPERYEIFAHCLVGILLLAALVFVVAFIVNLIVQIASWQREKALYPPTKEAFLQAEAIRSKVAGEAFSSYEESHREVLQEVLRNQEEYETLSASVGLPESFRFRGYLEAFSEYAAAGRAGSIPEAIDLYEKETAISEKARIRREAKEDAAQCNAARQEFQKRRAQFNVDPSTFSGKVFSGLTSF